MGWYPKGGDFATQPALAVIPPNQIDLFGIGNDGQLYLQFYDGQSWQPGPDTYYALGDTKKPYSNSHAINGDQNDQTFLGHDPLSAPARRLSPPKD